MQEEGDQEETSEAVGIQIAQKQLEFDDILLSPKIKGGESDDCTPRFTGKRNHAVQKKPAVPPKVQKKTLRATKEPIES